MPLLCSYVSTEPFSQNLSVVDCEESLMGWVSYHREKGESDRAHLSRELLDNTAHEIVTCASKNGVFYAAVRTNATGEVWALVVLMRRTRGEFNFAYKDMDETVGPTAVDAPPAVLDALTPTTNDYALAWRERCRANLVRRTAVRHRLRDVTEGVVIRMSSLLQFGNGLEARLFRCVERDGRTIRWQAITDDGTRFLCHLGPRWAERYTWEVIPPATTAEESLPVEGEMAVDSNRLAVFVQDEALLNVVLKLAAVAGCTIHREADVAVAKPCWSWASMMVLDTASAKQCAEAGLGRRDTVVLVADVTSSPEVFVRGIEVGAERVLALPGADAWLTAAFADAADGVPTGSRPDRGIQHGSVEGLPLRHRGVA